MEKIYYYLIYSIIKWFIIITCFSFVLGCVPNSTNLQDNTSTNSTYFKDGIPSDTYLEKDRWDDYHLNGTIILHYPITMT